MVPHNQTFGEGLRHSNGIEGFWSRLKQVCNFEHGLNPTTIEEVQMHVNEGLWRIQNRNNLHEALGRALQARAAPNPVLRVVDC